MEMQEVSFREQFHQWLEEEDVHSVRETMRNLHPADAAVKLAELRPEEIAAYLELVGITEGLTVFEFVPSELQRETLNYLPRAMIAQLIRLMSPDDRADLIEELDEEPKERLLSLLMQAERQELLKLLTYPEDSAGAFMTTDYALLRAGDTVQTALKELRFQAPKKEIIYYAYVVDQARRLTGIVSLRSIILAHPESCIRDIMNQRVISVKVVEDIENVAKEMTHYDFLAMPVVDVEDRLVGIITYDDVFDVMTEEATEDMYLLASLDTDEKVSSSLPRSVKLRVPWLMVNLLTALVAAFTVSQFTGTISQFVALAALMPIVAGIGGNAGTQSLTVVVRALALGEIKVKGNAGVLLRQVGIGLSCGIVCGFVMASIAYVWHRNIWLSLILWMAMTMNLILAGLFGAMVPITLRKLNLDPALGSSVFVTMATDVGGFLTFLGLATLFLHNLLGP